MKTNITLCFLLLCLLSQHRSNAQGNFPFPSTYAEWSFYSVSPVIGPGDDFFFIKNFLSGDSLFNGKHYSKLYEVVPCSCHACSVNGPYMEHWYPWTYLVGGLREEAGKVYYTGFGTPPFDYFYRPVTDTLLFDFTLNQGDTLLYGGYILRVTKIDHNVEGRRMVRINVDGAGKSFDWVEGIGGPFGPLETLHWISNNYYYDGSSCFAENQPGFCTAPCAAASGVDSPVQSESVSIFPSFAQDFVTVTTSETFGPYRLLIYSSDARLLKTVELAENTNMIPMGDLPSGILHFLFENASGQKISKTYVH